MWCCAIAFIYWHEKAYLSKQLLWHHWRAARNSHVAHGRSWVWARTLQACCTCFSFPALPSCPLGEILFCAFPTTPMYRLGFFTDNSCCITYPQHRKTRLKKCTMGRLGYLLWGEILQINQRLQLHLIYLNILLTQLPFFIYWLLFTEYWTKDESNLYWANPFECRTPSVEDIKNIFYWGECKLQEDNLIWHLEIRYLLPLR